MSNLLNSQYCWEGGKFVQLDDFQNILHKQNMLRILFKQLQSVYDKVKVEFISS